MTKLNNKERIQVTSILDMCEELSPQGRQNLILNLLRQQKRLSFMQPDMKNLTMIDLRNGIIAGSNICPNCSGHMARGEEYIN